MAYNEVGLPALYAALHDILTRYAIEGVALSVEDDEFGVQVFTDGPAAVGALAQCRDDERTWATVPALDTPPTELSVLRALARTALRLGTTDREVDSVTGLEVAVRRVRGVRTVIREGTVFRVLADDEARDQVIAELAAFERGTGIVVGAVVVVVESAQGDPEPSAAPEVRPARRVELVAVQSQPEAGELEVHLRFGDQRTVGRAPLVRAGAAAAEATLVALRDLGEDLDYRVGWVRTVDTLPNREFLVAVSLTRPQATAVYGLAPGTSPIQAAARATLDACNRELRRDPR